MNDRLQISKNNAVLKKTLSSIPPLISAGDYETAMQRLYGAGNYAWLNSCGQLACLEIESLIVQLSQALPIPQDDLTSDADPFVVTVLTSVHAAGGHSRLAWRWIQLDRKRKHHVILTNQGNSPIPIQLLELVDSGRATLTRLDDEPTLWGRASRLRQLAKDAESVVLHIHPDDPVAPVALARMPTERPVLFVDHASHVFWMGTCAANLVLTLHAEACRTTATRRGVPATQIFWWPMSFDLSRLDKAPRLPIRENLTIPSDAVILLTSGWPYKFHAIEGLSFSGALAPVLSSRPATHLIAVGPTAEDSAWKSLAAQFPGRIHLLGIQDEQFMTACYLACDIYLDSIPFSSGSAVIEAAALGKPVIKFATQEMRDCGFAVDPDAIPLPAYNWTDLDSYRNNLLELIDMSPSDRAVLGAMIRSSVRNWHNEDVSRFFLERAYRQAKNSSKIQINASLTQEKFDPLDRLLIALGENCRLCQDEKTPSAYMRLLQEDQVKAKHPLFNRFVKPDNISLIAVAVSTRGRQEQLDKTLASIQTQLRNADDILVISDEVTLPQKLSATLASWTLLLFEGDILENDALLLLEQAIIRKGGDATLVVYFDHDEIDIQGHPAEPHFKPDFNHDLLLSYPYIGRALAVRTSWAQHHLINTAGIFNLPLAYQLALQAFSDAGEVGFVHLPALIAHLSPDEPTVFASDSVTWKRLAQIAENHLQAQAPGTQMLEGPAPGTFQVLYPCTRTPLVSIVIPTRDQLPFLNRCIESLLEKTNYPNFEILVVDNDSQKKETREYLAGLAQLAPDSIRVLQVPGKFNFSRMNNLAVNEARGELILMLNNDTAALQPDWLTHMVRNALRNDVGVVGARLLYPDGSVQHAGVILGLRGPAEHPSLGMQTTDRGYLFRAQLQRNFSAVTAACLLVRKSLYKELGGLDETAFSVSYNDVDFCLRVGQTGRRIVWTPLATLLHEGSASQKRSIEATGHDQKIARFTKEQTSMYERWPEQIANDPAYNPNLSLTAHGYEIETNPLLRLDKLQGLTKHRVIAFAADEQGCGQYRIYQPMQAMLEAGLCTGGISPTLMGANLVLRSGADTLVFQRPITDEYLHLLESLQALKHVKKIYEVDDNLSRLPVKSAHRTDMEKNLPKRISKAISLCDRLVVSTEALAHDLAGQNDDIRVVQNRLSAAMWGTTPLSRQAPTQRKSTSKPRVGWAGGIGHQGDLEMIADVIKDLADQVDWIFFGMCPESIRPYVHEFYAGVPTLQYPAKLMAQEWDLAIAPLELNPFNECKSNLKLLEYGWCGVPVVCSDITPYQCDLPATRVKNRFKDWRDAICERIADLDACHQEGVILQAKVEQDWTLKGKNLQDWLDAWTD